MNTDEIKNFIAEKVDEGLSLSQIQDLLNEKNVKLTFMELRLIASEIESGVFKKQESAHSSAAKNAPSGGETAPEAENIREKMADNTEDGFSQEDTSADLMDDDPSASDGSRGNEGGIRGKTSVTVSPIQRPGFAACGSVSFGSGVTAEWFLDQTGRLGLDNVKGGKPDQQDIVEFQKELQKAFGA